MTAEKIVLATDFSEGSNAALEYASSLARDSGATLYIVHVTEPRSDYASGGAFTSGAIDPQAPLLSRQLADVLPTQPGVRCVHRLISGNPADEIIRLAAAENADLIVMATHGRRGLSRLLMGSIAESVVRRSPCPVLTVKSFAQQHPNA